ncbi:probable methyltransferase PMT19 isoform X1 [Trifolium pratense]|uniref:probable methyltransferase PMT19 isoform X1 n=2 Tax=Trifolium pratense TaxID=57577 RepID=UPI001E691696|nr:probable methyltransferase PMT19 isoform X1 [Trifolium pratense]
MFSKYLNIFFITTLFIFLYIITSSFFTSPLTLLHQQNSIPTTTKNSHFQFCPTNFTNYCPCQDPKTQKKFPKKNYFRKERHCPKNNQRLRCLIPKPIGYQKPFTWPKSKDNAWFSNVPFTKLVEYKKSQNWIRLDGDHFVFPGGGTSFPDGVKGYVDDLKNLLPVNLESGSIRTVLDVGCGVASFGASLMDYDILTMSIAPSDEHEAQVLFALERGLPAMLGVFSTHRLTFPSKSFDMAHCSRCLVPWTANDGLYLREIDRMLRPGGFWVLSGPPINWRVNYKAWETEATVLEKEQNSLEELAMQMCWEKVAEGGQIAIWQKPINHIKCMQKLNTLSSPKFCSSSDPDAGWYTKMTACIFPLPEVKDIDEISGGILKRWPMRLNASPPRLRNENDISSYNEDSRTWKMRVSYYEVMLKSFSSGRYRNVMDMNAGFGGFAAAMVKYTVWVMNVVPFDAKSNNLGVIYERGLIGTYMDWCEPFSTYPRTYDLIHASGIFSMYMNKCDITDIVLEMHRIIRPGGTVIIRDYRDVILKVKEITDRIRWEAGIVEVASDQNGSSHQEIIMVFNNTKY